MIIYIDTSNIELEIISKYANIMPLDRQIEYSKMAKEEDKINCILAFLILKKYYKNSKNNDLNFLYTSKGKPYFKDNPIFFNISHSKNIVAVGISEKFNIGIDVEKIENVDKDIINILYSNIEKEKYKESLLDKKTYYKTWVMKESYSKMLGLGLYFNFNNISLELEKDMTKVEEYYIHSYIINDYYFAITTKDINININNIKLENLIGGK